MLTMVNHNLTVYKDIVNTGRVAVWCFKAVGLMDILGREQDITYYNK